MSTAAPKIGDLVSITLTIQGITETGDVFSGKIENISGNIAEVTMPILIDTDPDEKLVDPAQRYTAGPDAIVKVKTDNLTTDGGGGWKTRFQLRLIKA